MTDIQRGPRFVKNDTDGSLKAAALQASATWWASPGNAEDANPDIIINTAEAFYDWLREDR